MTKLNSNRWFALIILLIGFFMILLDTTVVNVSIPTIIHSLGASLPQVEWIVSGYALSFAALLITFGRLGDIYGRRLLFMVGLGTFVITSAISGEAHSANILIISRIFQGIGGAMISPAVLSIISSNFRDRERAIAFGVFGAVSGIAVALGPVLGGWLTTYYSWRWIFRINIPIGIIGIILAWIFINESKSERAEGLDLAGMITSTIGFFALVFGLIEGRTYGWLHPSQAISFMGLTWGTNHYFSIIPITFLLSAIFLALFLIIQVVKTHRNTGPAVNIDFFKAKTFRYGLVTIAVLALGEFSSLFTLPIFLQSIHGFSPLKSGVATLPMALSLMVAAPLSAFLVGRIGTKWVITVGIFLEGLGIFILSLLTINTQYVDLLPGLMILGFGLGLAISQNTQVILSEINPIHSGSASGVLNTIRQIGSALGIAIIGAVLAHIASVNIPKNVHAAYTPGLPNVVKTEIANAAGSSSVNSVGAGQPQLSLPIPVAIQNNPSVLASFKSQVEISEKNIVKAVDTGLTSAISSAMRVGSIFVALGALCSLLIPNVPAPVKKDEIVG